MAVAHLSSSSSTESATSTPDSFKFETKYIVLSFLNHLTKTHNCDGSSTGGIQGLHMSSTDSDQRTMKYFKMWKENQPHSSSKQKRKSNTCTNEAQNKKKTSHLSQENLRKSSSHNSSFVKKPVTRKFKSVRKFSLPLSSDHINVKCTASTPTLLSRSVSNGSTHDHDDSSSHDCNSYNSDADDELEASHESIFMGSSLGMSSSRSKEHVHRLSTVVSESETEPDPHGKLSMKPVSLGVISSEETFVYRPMSSQSISSSSKNSATQDEVLSMDCPDGDDNTVSDSSHSDFYLSEELGAKSAGDEDTHSVGIDAQELPNGNGGTVDRSCLFLNLGGNTPVEFDCVVLSLQEEVHEQMVSLESEYADAIKSQLIPRVESPFECPLTPQSECARLLAIIGDDIDIQHRERIESAVGHLFSSSSGVFSYEAFLCMARDVVDDNMPGWRQVAILLMYSQGVAIRLVHSGHRGISQLVDYSVQLISDLTASFIIGQGGWGAIMNSDPSLTSTASQSSPESGQIINPFLLAMLNQDYTERYTECQTERYTEWHTEQCSEHHSHRQQHSERVRYRQAQDDQCHTRTQICSICNTSDDVQTTHTSDHVRSQRRHSSEVSLDDQCEETDHVDSEMLQAADDGNSWVSRWLDRSRRLYATSHGSTTFVLLAASIVLTIAFFKSRSG